MNILASADLYQLAVYTPVAISALMVAVHVVLEWRA